MKIAVLSMQRVENYGSVLQAYSLKRMIEDVTGEEVKFVDIDKSRFDKVDMPVNTYKENVLPDEITSWKSSPIYVCSKIKNKLKVQEFKHKIHKFQDEVLCCKESDNDEEYDIMVVGSDEVFNAKTKLYFQLHGDVKNAKKLITYAASCGNAVVCGILPQTLPIVKKAMSNFAAMSVRDDGTYEYVKNLLGGGTENIAYHLDPVLAGDLYKRRHERRLKKRYMVVYAYGDRIKKKSEIDAIKKFAKQNKLKIIALGAPQFWCGSFIAADPFELLDYFYFAECVVTDTFHGAVFSVINHQKFAVLLRASNRNKLGDLMNRLGLSAQIAEKSDELGKILSEEIDYVGIDAFLDKERNRAKQYLVDNCRM